MKILLVQDHVHLPGLGGGIKANRLLLEGLARRGHSCAIVSPALTTRAGPTTRDQFLSDRKTRGITIESCTAHAYRYGFGEVLVDATDYPTRAATSSHIRRRIEELAPDCVIVDEDKHRTGLAPSLAAAPRGVLLLLQTTANLPFGPHSSAPDPAQTDLMRSARGILVISRFLQRYLARYASLSSTVVNLPLYGPGPFPLKARFGVGTVLLVNPCLEKGLDIFVALARAVPDAPFAAVPTWGADDRTLRRLADEPNIEILDPTEDIGEIVQRARVLVAPSLWPEAFGYVVPEAMLRGVPPLVSDVGGLSEAALGAATVLPVTPLVRRDGRYQPVPQDVRPWTRALARLLEERDHYRLSSQAAHAAAVRFASRADVATVERRLCDMASA